MGIRLTAKIFFSSTVNAGCRPGIFGGMLVRPPASIFFNHIVFLLTLKLKVKELDRLLEKQFTFNKVKYPIQ